MKTWYVIPARKNSKGFKFKNRILLNYTLSQIPKNKLSKTIITTDDEQIIDLYKSTKVDIIERISELSQDDTAIQDVMADVIEKRNIKPDDNIIMLYLTYPGRTWNEIKKIYNFYKKSKAKSLLCAKNTTSHPYLCLQELPNNHGKQLMEHNLYRRQDYPKCFEISHFVCIFIANELKNLNKNMYNEDTKYFSMKKDVIDVDYDIDYRQFLYK